MNLLNDPNRCFMEEKKQQASEVAYLASGTLFMSATLLQPRCEIVQLRLVLDHLVATMWTRA